MSGQQIASHGETSRRVLIVDDEREFADGLGECLIGEGYDVAVAYGAAPALSVAKWSDPQVVILDFRLGPDSGLDLARQLRERRPELICILLTAHADVGSAVCALRSGLYDYLQKPVRADEVCAALDRCFEKLRLEDVVSRQQQELKWLSLTDPLTQLPNRRHFDQRLSQEVERARRYGNDLCVALCDVDHFKAVNDRLGHNAGDEVLKAVASFLEQHLRDADFVARWGGEEFAVLLPETTLEGAVEVLDRLRVGLAARDWPRLATPLTASFGVTPFGVGDSSADAVRRADGALYESKQGGRNKVTARRAPERPSENRRETVSRRTQITSLRDRQCHHEDPILRFAE